jgi:hypothetical protein
MSGHLLLGVVRIYARKMKYLFDDCSEALVKLKQAFTMGAGEVDLAAEQAPVANVLPEPKGDLDLAVPENFALPILPDDGVMPVVIAHAGRRADIDQEPQAGTQDVDELPAFAPPDEFGDEAGVRPAEVPAADMEPANISALDDSGIPDEPQSTMVGPASVSKAERSDIIPQSEEKKRGVKRRPLHVDTSTALSRETMAAWVEDAGPIVQQQELAPTSKKQMAQRQLELGGAPNVLKAPLLQYTAILRPLFNREPPAKAERAKEPEPEDEGAVRDAVEPSGFEQVPVDADNVYEGMDDTNVGGGADDTAPPVYAAEPEEQEEAPLPGEDAAAPQNAEGDLKTYQMGQFLELQYQTQKTNSLSFNNLIEGKRVKTAARVFYHLLVLKTQDLVDLKQAKPYGDIDITRTGNFGAFLERAPRAELPAH